MEEFRKPRFSIERWGFLLRKEDALCCIDTLPFLLF